MSEIPMEVLQRELARRGLRVVSTTDRSIYWQWLARGQPDMSDYLQACALAYQAGEYRHSMELLRKAWLSKYSQAITKPFQWRRWMVAMQGHIINAADRDGQWYALGNAFRKPLIDDADFAQYHPSIFPSWTQMRLAQDRRPGFAERFHSGPRLDENALRGSGFAAYMPRGPRLDQSTMNYLAQGLDEGMEQIRQDLITDMVWPEHRGVDDE